jgi:hypothetical protein
VKSSCARDGELGDCSKAARRRRGGGLRARCIRADDCESAQQGEEGRGGGELPERSRRVGTVSGRTIRRGVEHRDAPSPASKSTPAMRRRNATRVKARRSSACGRVRRSGAARKRSDRSPSSAWPDQSSRAGRAFGRCQVRHPRERRGGNLGLAVRARPTSYALALTAAFIAVASRLLRRWSITT